MRSIFLAVMVITSTPVLGDDGPIGPDVSVVVKSFSYFVDGVRSATSEAFAIETAADHGGTYKIVVCPGTDPRRLAGLFDFLKRHAPSAVVFVEKGLLELPTEWEENK